MRFRDGTQGEVDLSSELVGPIFQPLRNVARFREFRLDPTWHTLVWPNGADIAAEHLHHLVRVGLSKS